MVHNFFPMTIWGLFFINIFTSFFFFSQTFFFLPSSFFLLKMSNSPLPNSNPAFGAYNAVAPYATHSLPSTSAVSHAGYPFNFPVSGGGAGISHRPHASQTPQQFIQQLQQQQQESNATPTRHTIGILKTTPRSMWYLFPFFFFANLLSNLFP